MYRGSQNSHRGNERNQGHSHHSMQYWSCDPNQERSTKGTMGNWSDLGFDNSR